MNSNRLLLKQLMLLVALSLLTSDLWGAVPTAGIDLKRHLALMAEGPEYDDPELNEYVTKVGNRVLAQSEQADKNYTFIIQDIPIPNARVAGYEVVYINRGLLNVLNSEAELAGVMAHELGHNIAGHVKESVARDRRNRFFATVASILVGNSSLGDAMMAQSDVNRFKYSRLAELEADSFASKYLYAAGYEPSQLIGALSQLADFGTFFAQVSNQAPSHHGLAATHPRTDQRLRKVVEDAGVLPPGEGYVGRDEYREAVSGIVYGPNYRRTAPKGYKRYSNENLNITFLYPDTWSFDLKGAKIVLKDAQKTAQLKISIEPTLDIKVTSEEAIKAKYPDDLVDLQKIHPDATRDLGMIGARPAQRVALAMVARNTFHFLGIAKNNQITAEQDREFVEIIRSFRRMTAKDRTDDYVTEIYYERLKPGETFESLARDAKLNAATAEMELRVLNGYYPTGEAEPGTWIKKLRKVKIDMD
ncbi:M48 family metalloprotease [Arenicella xantha]|uniref:Putative Zn-dependent protease n=1 Tax=Arenicella xantha TaxID=644221 RepID=A0A395JUL0_9GAMM|nr:M48 family metalloprotease [Arenicella xantha]RBP53228.1 putative Zn-dependent protease [Arenicella xantha]